MTYFNRDNFLTLSGINGNFSVSDKNYSIISKQISLQPELIGGNFWTTKTSLSVGVGVSSSFTLNGYVYRFGSNGTTNDNSQYNDNTNVWTTKTPGLEGGKWHTGGCSVNGIGYAVGGQDVATFTTYFTHSYNDVLNSWVKLPPPVNYKFGAQCFVINDIIYAEGGTTDASSPLNSTDTYSPLLNSWTTTSPGPSLFYGVGWNMSGFGWCVQGTSNNTSANGAINKFNAAAGTWTLKTALQAPNTPTFSLAGAVINGLGYTFSGYATGPVQKSVAYEYNDFVDVWSAKKNSTNVYSDNTGSSLNGFGYICDGNGPVSSACEQYRNTNLYKISGSLKKSFKAPKKVLVGTCLNDDNWTVPIQIRVDGVNWKYMESNKDSLIKSGFSIVNTITPSAATFTPSAGVGEYVYEIQVGLPSFVAGIGGGLWVNKAAAGTARSAPATFQLNGYGYVCSGVVSPSAASTEVNQYNDESNTWTTKANVGTALEGSGGFNLKGYGYKCGGLSSSTVNERYDDVANAWLTKAVLTTGVHYSAGVSLNGLGYVLGGGSGNLTQQYTPNTDAWAAKATAGTARNAGDSVSANGFIYYFNGNLGSTFSNENVQYNDASNVWTTKATAGTARTGVAGFSVRGSPFSCNGATASVLNEVNQYFDTTDVWLVKSNGSSARVNLNGFALNGYGFICSGDTTPAGAGTKTSEVNQYVVNDRIPVLTVSLRVEE